MEIEVAKKILEDSGISRDEFAGMVGVKPVTMRMTFQNGRFSKKAVIKLKELASDVVEQAELKEVDKLIEEAREEKVGMIKQSMGSPLEALGVVYMVPRNPYWRMVEFADGTHGKFRAQAGKFLLGARVKLRKVGVDEWELCGEYDRKDRLCG
jgi:G:T/U-mismatch repair DNA glycosylase|tara:strand:- start:53 stop:511 length:459 start_codon:yes stop_codon:yes gene_type:complete